MFIRIMELIFTSIVGTILHFTYQLSNKSLVVGLFSAINESTWEHIKMATTARLIWIPIEIHFLGQNNNYFISVAIELLLIILLIPLLFYGYKIFTKKNIIILDISIFYIALLLSNLVGTKILLASAVTPFINYHSIIIIVMILLFNIIFTIKPPHNFLFKDPITKKYGINK